MVVHFCINRLFWNVHPHCSAVWAPGLSAPWTKSAPASWRLMSSWRALMRRHSLHFSKALTLVSSVCLCFLSLNSYKYFLDYTWMSFERHKTEWKYMMFVCFYSIIASYFLKTVSKRFSDFFLLYFFNIFSFNSCYSFAFQIITTSSIQKKLASSVTC